MPMFQDTGLQSKRFEARKRGRLAQADELAIKAFCPFVAMRILLDAYDEISLYRSAFGEMKAVEARCMGTTLVVLGWERNISILPYARNRVYGQSRLYILLLSYSHFAIINLNSV